MNQDVVANPLGLVQKCLDKAILETGGVPGGDWGVKQLFTEAITKSGLETVTSLLNTYKRHLLTLQMAGALPLEIVA